MASNHGSPPPPPPPPHPYGAPNQRTHANSLLAHSQHQMQPPMQSMMHFSNRQVFQHQTFQQLNPVNPYSYSQYQYYQAQHRQQTPYYSQYAYAQTPPPPPPPPRSHSNSNQHAMVNDSTSEGPNKIIDAKASSRHPLPSPTRNDPPKKGNDKMVQKYSGRGLKTITISGPGLRPQKFKICVGNHPDDIKKWIDERRRRFPRRDGSQRDNGGGGGSGALEASAGCKRTKHEADARCAAQKKAFVDDEGLVGGVACKNNEGGGTLLSSLLEGYDSSSSEDGGPKSKSHGLVPPLKDDGAKTNSAAVDPSPSQPKRICKYFQRGKCHHGDSCKFLHSNEGSPPQPPRQKGSSRSDMDNKARNRYEEELKMLGLASPGHGNKYSGGEKVVSSTSLLHKLLQRDRERERRLTLQLLRYIVDCDYFRTEDITE